MCIKQRKSAYHDAVAEKQAKEARKEVDKESPRDREAKIRQAKRIMGLHDSEPWGPELKKKFRKFQFQLHPDKTGNNDGEEKLKEINKAYNVLREYNEAGYSLVLN